MSEQSLENSTAFPDTGGVRANDLLHDILNNNQIAIGYLELALEQMPAEDDLRSMLGQVQKALRRSSDLALTAYRCSRTDSAACDYGVRIRSRHLK